jgi:polysaccharide deacetylase family protein (PEP-CTERM system associated)
MESLTQNGGAPISHIMSVDVEDYFQVEAFTGSVKVDSWDSWPSRVVANTQRALDLLDQHNVKATFFFLGWVAERFPALVRDAAARGHEVACHSYWHRAIYRLSPEEFREDTRMAKDVIEQAAGVAVTGYRAPTWSITRKSLWAPRILAEAGFLYDSSVYPIRHDLYGIPGAERVPYILDCGDNLQLREYPPATLSVGGFTLPAAGGGYLRLFPMAFTHLAFRKTENEGRAVVVYFHPWELDPKQPRVRSKLRSRFRHYTNLARMQGRLGQLMSRYRFQRFADVLRFENQQENLIKPALQVQ